jgi:hypothetical protein
MAVVGCCYRYIAIVVSLSLYRYGCIASVMKIDGGGKSFAWNLSV